MPRTFLKDPDATKDYKVDWAAAPPVGPFLAVGETIQTSTWLVPTGITKDSSTNTTTTATIWLSGGTAGQKYTVTNRVVTNQGRTDDRSILIIIANQ